jgi:tRNA dimethylallyltransferase
MESDSKKPELIAIVGPTASGKSALALELADLTPVEIIAADSRTIYRDMNIGTAKPSRTERERVPYWGLDLLDPGEPFSVHDFQAYAKAKIEEINRRGKIALLVGGTGLYLDSVLYDFEFTDSETSQRNTLEAMDVADLQRIIEDKSLPVPENKLNKRHLVRTIERQGKQGSRKPLRQNTIIVGLWPGGEELRANIDRRAEEIFTQNVIDETKELIDKYGSKAVLATGGIVYKICTRLLEGGITEQTATTLFKTADWQYARRQRTWFKKNNDIVWFTDRKAALDYLKHALNT